MDAKVNELFQSIGCSRSEVLPSDCVCKACFQKVDKLLKHKGSINCILKMLKASIQAFALVQTISTLQSAERIKRRNTSYKLSGSF